MNAPQAAPAALWWNDGDAFRSRLFDAISLLLPSGEQFVIATLSDWLLVPAAPAATPALCLSARRFIGEEQAHSRAHQLYNDRLAASVPAARLERRVAMAMQPMAQWRLGTRVAFCAAFEQLTALLSTEVLRPGSVWMTDNATPQARLWRWHCAEELGHRHVAPEVAAALGVSRTHCALALLAAAGYLWIDVLVALCAMLFVDVRASRIGLPRLLFQTGSFALRASPSMLRMAGAGLRLMFRGR